MKTIKFIATAVMCLLSLTANAQSTMRIEFKEGKQMEIPVSSVASINWFTNETTPNTPDISPSEVQAVDLGLSVKWANMNIGATSPEKSGYYFAWGGIVGDKNINESSYRYYISTTTKDKDGFDVTTKGYTKYVTKSRASTYGYDGFYDDKTVLDPEDDAATVNWGGSWRMPTKAEQDELRTKCTWLWTELNGKKGYKVTGPNGNFIFLPAAGYFFSSSSSFSTMYENWYGYYWSASLDGTYQGSAYYLHLQEGSKYYESHARYYGQSVRAVCP